MTSLAVPLSAKTPASGEEAGAAKGCDAAGGVLLVTGAVTTGGFSDVLLQAHARTANRGGNARASVERGIDYAYIGARRPACEI